MPTILSSVFGSYFWPENSKNKVTNGCYISRRLIFVIAGLVYTEKGMLAVVEVEHFPHRHISFPMHTGTTQLNIDKRLGHDN